MTAKSSAFYVFGYFLWEGYGCMFSIKSVLPQRHGERRENLLNFRNKKNTPWKNFHGVLGKLHLPQGTDVDLVIPFTGIGITNTGGLRFDAGTYVHGLAAFERGHIQCDTARAGKPDLAWRTGSEVPIERGARRAAWVGSTGHSLTALERVTVGKSSRTARI